MTLPNGSKVLRINNKQLSVIDFISQLMWVFEIHLVLLYVSEFINTQCKQ